ncbi:MAG: FtsH protease activity modulator HflK [Verrucomicrobiota bacterium]|nr:FtsH protease activity modulator HflK [Verrucomicrobiota bacterium]
MKPIPQIDSASQLDAGREAFENALKICFFILKIACAFVLIVMLVGSFVVIDQHETGVRLRFGKISENQKNAILKPGMHFAFPYPIDEVIKISTARVNSVSSNSFWYALSDEEKRTGFQTGPLPQTLKPGIDGYVLSGDKNIIHYKWTLRYSVNDPINYVMHAKDPELLLRFILENAVNNIVSKMTIDEAWRTNIETLRTTVERFVAEKARTMKLGIKLERINLDEKVPPRQLKKAFDAVVEEELKMSEALNKAKNYLSKTVNQAHANASGIITKAESYKTRKINNTKADATYFNDMLVQYKKNPKLLKRRLYEESITKVLNNAEEKFLLSKRKNGELRILLERMQDEKKDDKNDKNN